MASADKQDPKDMADEMVTEHGEWALGFAVSEIETAKKAGYDDGVRYWLQVAQAMTGLLLRDR